uniref:ORF3 n=1 Tax=Zhangye Chuvi tick virus 1 TaxID=2972091 RepID=A0A9E8AA25_9VIRU|nr:MAG: ORF3 [Zhangye Chuvi tick virus 1]
MGPDPTLVVRTRVPRRVGLSMPPKRRNQGGQTPTPVPVVKRGKFDNDAQKQAAFDTIDYLENLVGFTAECVPGDQEISGIPAVTLLSQGEAYLMDMGSDMTIVTLLAIANSIAPCLTFLPKADANKRASLELGAFIKRDIVKRGPWVRITATQWDEALQERGALHGVKVPASSGLAAYNPVETLSVEEQTKLLNFLVNHQTPQLTRISTQLFCTLYVALAKRGTITEAKLAKINGELEETLGWDIGLDSETIKCVHARLAPEIPYSELPQIFKRWSTEIAKMSLRMRITLDQAAGSGLTAFDTVKAALQRFPEFPWAAVFALIPAEADTFLEAVQLVGKDAYYGFRSDLGKVAASGYRTLAYVAKELMIRYGGPDGATLRGYKGWTRFPQHKEALDQLIEDKAPRTDPVATRESTETYTDVILALGGKRVTERPQRDVATEDTDSGGVEGDGSRDQE